MDIKGLDTVVFSGGGVRGLAYVGALMAFEDTYKIKASAHFKTFAGSSVGALFALLLVVDSDINTTLAVFETIGIHSMFQKDFTWLLTNFALNDAGAVRRLVETILIERQLDPTITMAELYAHTRKTLVVAAVDLLTASMHYLDHTNEGADFPVITAVMGSMALPPLFPPVAAGKMMLVDGGLLDNFPVARFCPEKTLGIRTRWYIDSANPMVDISAFYDRVLAIVQLPMHSVQVSVGLQYTNVVYIDLGTVKADNASIDTRDLIFKGYRSAVARFQNSVSTVGSAETENPTRFLCPDRKVPAYLDVLKNARV
jgi:predicted patatin/cPLA2 family phospholipase